MLGQRGDPPKASPVPFAGGWLSACTGCTVQGISGVWFHLQPSTKAPSCLPPLLPMARLRFLGPHTVLTSLVVGAQQSSPDTGVAAWGCPAPPGVPDTHDHVTATCPGSELPCECPSCWLGWEIPLL